MNKLAKRALSMLLALVLCLGLLPVVGAPAEAATVEYVTADGVSLYNAKTKSSTTVNVILNWGERGRTASFLSENAVSFYADNGVSYAELSALAGNSDQDAVAESDLYAALNELLTDTHSLWTSYDGTRALYQYTDCQYADVNSLTCFYSDVSIGPEWDSGKTWNREHTWPDSKGLEGSDEDDIMMLRPTAKSANNSRNNTAYGVSDGYFDPNKFATTTDVRGDVARTILYQYVRWGNTDYMWGTDGVIESAEVLLDWMEADPVDTWEMGRNDSVESITGTRNVFVDYPELVFDLFETEIPADMPTPSTGVAADEVIEAVVNNADFGSAYVSDNVITAVPNVGYKVVGYTVLEGNAIVTQNKNVFLVDTDADCKIQINFEAREVATVLYSQNGTIAASANAYVGDSVQLADYTGAVPEGYSFLGWVNAPVDATDTEPATILKAGEAYTPTASTTLYALLSWVDDSQSSGATYTKYTGALTEGNYLLTGTNKSAVGALTAQISSNRFVCTDVTVSNDSISNPADSLVWTVSASGSYWTFYNAATGKYASATGASNKAKLVSSVGDDLAKWDYTDAGAIENVGNRAKTNVNYTLRRNGTYGFAPYAASTGSAITLYKLDENAGTTMFGTATATGGGSVTTPEATLNGGAAISLAQAVEYATKGSVIRLQKNVSADITLKEGVTLDLAGCTFTGGIVGGIITDSTDGKGCIVNANAPADSAVKDGEMLLKGSDGWHVYDFTMKVSDKAVVPSADGSSVHFWFDVAFTNVDAYKAIYDSETNEEGSSGFAVGAKFSWNGGTSLDAGFDTNMTIVDWAAKMYYNPAYSFYVKVTGLSAATESGTLTVVPTVSGKLGSDSIDAGMAYTHTVN